MADELRKETPIKQVKQKDNTKNNNVEERKSSTEIDKAELRAEIYKECTQNLRWALGIITTIIGLAAALVVAMQFKNTGEYKNALEDIRYYRNESKDSSQKISNEGAAVVKTIQEKGNEAINQIESKSKEEIEKLKVQLLEQREIFGLWINVLVEENDESTIILLNELESKDPNNWAVYDFRAYIYRSEAKKEVNLKTKEELYSNAKIDYEKSYDLRKGKGMGIIHLADICAELDDEKECRKWLERGMTDNSLPSLKDAMRFDHNINKYSNRDWFKEIKWKENK